MSSLVEVEAANTPSTLRETFDNERENEETFADRQASVEEDFPRSGGGSGGSVGGCGRSGGGGSRRGEDRRGEDRSGVGRSGGSGGGGGSRGGLTRNESRVASRGVTFSSPESNATTPQQRWNSSSPQQQQHRWNSSQRQQQRRRSRGSMVSSAGRRKMPTPPRDDAASMSVSGKGGDSGERYEEMREDRGRDNYRYNFSFFAFAVNIVIVFPL